MQAFGKLILVDAKLFTRNLINLFFLLIFPILILVIFGAMWGNEPVEMFGGYGSVDVSVPGYIAAMVIGTAGFLNLPIDLVNYRERGILRRYRATPVKPAWVLGSQLVVTLGATVVGTALQLGAGRLLYQMRMPAATWPALLGFFFICLSVFSIGFLIASLMKTSSAARTIGMAVYFPMMFLSGGTMPREVMPESLTRVADLLPLTHAVSLFKDLWFGRGWDLTHAAVLGGIALTCTLIAVLLFRWE